MFLMVFPSIIKSQRLYIQHQLYVIQVRRLQSTNLYDICLMLYVQCWTPDDGRKDRPKHVEWYSINSKNRASSWFYYRNISGCTVPLTSYLPICSALGAQRDYCGRITLVQSKNKINTIQSDTSLFNERHSTLLHVAIPTSPPSKNHNQAIYKKHLNQIIVVK